MVSFTCQSCQDVIKKPKVIGHSQSCGGPSSTFTCVDCMNVFTLQTIREHTSCVTEVEKYQGKWLQAKSNKNGHKSGDGEQTPRPPPLRPPRPAMNDLSDSDSDEDWVRAPPARKRERSDAAESSPSPAQKSYTKEKSPPRSAAASSVKATVRRTPSSSAPRADRTTTTCLVPSFALGTREEVLEVIRGILAEEGEEVRGHAGKTGRVMGKKDLAKALVSAYTKRIAKNVRKTLEEALEEEPQSGDAGVFMRQNSVILTM